LAHALKTEITEPDREALRAFLAGLPDEPGEGTVAETGDAAM
jgi:hypothetical protein